MKKNTSIDDKTNIFGERLKQFRTQNLKISQKEFSEIIGIPQSTLSSYESGKIKPTIDVVINISKTFSVSVDWLCGRDMGFQVNSLGDLMKVMFELFEIEEFDLKTMFHYYPNEKLDEEDDSHRNFARLTFYYHFFADPDSPFGLGDELINVIEQAYKITDSYRKFEKTYEDYEREKDFWADNYRNIPLTKVSREGLSEAELEQKKIDYWREYFEKNASSQKKD